MFFERPAPPSGPPAKAKTLVIGGEAPKKAAQVTIGGDGAPQFFERPAPPEGAPAKARTLVIGGDAPPKKAVKRPSKPEGGALVRGRVIWTSARARLGLGEG